MPTLAEPVLTLAESRPSATPFPAACLPHSQLRRTVQPHCLPPNSPGRRWPSPPARRSPRRPHARPASVPQRRAPCSSPHPPPRTVGRAFCGAKHARGRVKGRGKGRCEGRCEARCEGRCETAAGPGRLGSGWSLRAGWGRGPCEGSSRDSVQRVHWVCRRGRVALQGGRVAADLEKLPRLFKELPG